MLLGGAGHQYTRLLHVGETGMAVAYAAVCEVPARTQENWVDTCTGVEARRRPDFLPFGMGGISKTGSSTPP